MRSALGVAPSGASDFIPKSYADPRAVRGMNPPSGGFILPTGVISWASAAFSTGLSGHMRCSPIDIGPQPMTLQRMSINVQVALVGGSGVACVMGLYPNLDSACLPDCSNGPIFSGSVTLTATGQKDVTTSTVLQPGRYWAAILYKHTSAPTTAPSFMALTGSVALWVTAFPSAGGGCRTLDYNVASASLPTSALTASSWTFANDSNTALMGLQAA